MFLLCMHHLYSINLLSLLRIITEVPYVSSNTKVLSDGGKWNFTFPPSIKCSLRHNLKFPYDMMCSVLIICHFSSVSIRIQSDSRAFSSWRGIINIHLQQQHVHHCRVKTCSGISELATFKINWWRLPSHPNIIYERIYLFYYILCFKRAVYYVCMYYFCSDIICCLWNRSLCALWRFTTTHLQYQDHCSERFVLSGF